MADERIIVAGGGIGGLAAALGLAKAGCRVLVLERASAFGEIGAGIQLGPNAFHAFDWLGVGEAARSVAVYIDSLRLMDALGGQEIARIPLLGEFRQRFGNPYAVVHRGQLHGALLKACEAHDRIALQTNARVGGYKQDAAGVDVLIDDGDPVRGTALIGADGLWSAIREQVVGDGPPRVSGHSTYRSVISFDEMPEAIRWNAATLWAGPKCHIVHYPLQGGDAFNLVVTYHNDAPEPVAGQPVGHEEVRRGFEQVCDQAREVIERGRDWRLWVLCDREPVTGWVDGRVALLGDAAHPMLQYFAQGACMALEDAVCLGDSVMRHDGDVVAALPVYCARRQLRTARVQLSSRAIGEHIYHPEGSHARLRDAIMGAKGESDWCDTLAWLYGANALEAEPPPISATSKGVV